jgi:hypothetical protein
MVYRLMAGAVLALHVAFVLFVVFGGLLVLWRRRIVWLHLPALVWGVLIELTGIVCPLTPLEKRFRELGGRSGYEGGFLERYAAGLLYPDGLTRRDQIALGLLLIAFNLVVYTIWWKRKRVDHPPAGRG